eukprot:TRINITY_DN1332_c0_g2_i1.p1 TRINITY_DN1332_c0_g2~~TRINITY_DN1332_c0_g2_i1.p1  ORF type:complete len:790 (+),score=282.59 TRINITY_DN1332_c0_g2_i1:141-2510(+)
MEKKKVVKKKTKVPGSRKTLEDFFDNEGDYQSVIAKGEPWNDPDFPHTDASINVVKKSFPWLSVKSIFKGAAKIYGSFSCDDVQQGALGDCYLLSAIAAVAEFPARIEELFIQREVNKAGCYVVKLFLCGQYVNVAVDDFFPVNTKKEPAFVGAKANELWVMLIEKAWAKIHGSYASIAAGDSRESFSALTGAPVKYHKHSLYTPEKLWKLIHAADKEKYVMSTGADTATQGIFKGHAYTLINAYEFLLNKQKIQLVQLRNPWGKSEWTGEWHDSDPKWSPALKKKLNHVVRNDGIFFMPFDQFHKIFVHTFISYSRDNYVHSGLVVEEKKATVAFKITKTTNGHVSAYAITKRIGKIINPTYEVPTLVLTLKKQEQDKKTWTQVDEKKSNVIGHVSIKAKFEPGIYLLSASYETEPMFPYIAFAGYTDLAIKFVHVKPKGKSEVTEEKVVKEALETDKPAYKPVKKENNLAGAFKTCPKAHPLKSTTAGTEYICENCRKKGPAKNGWWVCNECNYQICLNCRPKTLAKVEKKKDAEEIKCNKDHVMKFSADKGNTVYNCESCGKAFYGSVTRWNCPVCKISLCRKCMAPPKDFKPGKEVLEINVCTDNHPLEFVITESEEGMYECTICSKVGETHDGRWTCFTCGMNMCLVCKPKEKAKEGAVVVKTKTLVCKKKHLLGFTCSPPPEGMSITCDKCNKKVTSDYWRWNCEECGLDVCSKCRPGPEGGRKDILCPKMHMLIYSELPKGKATFGRCSSCYNSVSLLSGRYCCLPCKYVCCKKCAAALAKA